jgi:hypothetical protein
MQSTNRLLALLALATAGLPISASAVTTLNDTLAASSDWRYISGWAKGGASFGASGLTMNFAPDALYQTQVVRYVGPGYYRTNEEAQDSFNWFGHQGPVTYSFTLADFSALSTKTGTVGFSAGLALVCNDTTPYGEPVSKAATVIWFSIEDVGPRPQLDGQNQFIAKLSFKINRPASRATDQDRLIRFANEKKDILPVPYGTWSMTIDGENIWITNPLGQRSEVAKLPNDLVLAHAAYTANLYLFASNNGLPPGPVSISRVTVTSGAR